MRIALPLLVLLLISCSTGTDISSQHSLLIGTWKLIAAKTIQNDSVHIDDLSGKEMIKVINGSHFAFLNHDLKTDPDDSLDFFVSGGGQYTLEGQQYTEFLEYCNFRQWEGHTFEFTITIKNDTLIQRGQEEIEELGVNREIIETYIRTGK